MTRVLGIGLPFGRVTSILKNQKSKNPLMNRYDPMHEGLVVGIPVIVVVLR